MWSSEQDNRNNHNSGHGSSSRIVSSSSSRTSPSSNNSSILPQTPRRTIEEVWKDITLTSLHQERPLAPLLEPHPHPHHQHNHLHRAHPTASPSFRAMILQDFLSGPCSTVSPAAAVVEDIPLPSPPPPLPPTALSLNSGHELRYQGGAGGAGGSLLINAHSHSRSSSNSSESRVNGQTNNKGHGGFFISANFSNAVIGPSSPTGLFSFCSKKRTMPEVAGIGGDRRHKRMIKNRESAARSRARKQAHLSILSTPSLCFLLFILLYI